ncbi:glycoside hydrolase family 6 protein [Rathayibacter sp. CAU 1779]
MKRSLSRSVMAAVAVGACAIGGLAMSLPAQAAGTAAGNHALGTSTKLFVKAPDSDAVKQGVKLLLTKGGAKDAAALAKVELTPQAVWLDGGTAADVRKTVQKTMLAATLEKATPVFVAYDIPGRDCSQYSAGGAANTADYESWIDGIAAGIGNGKAAILVEPDGLGLLPTTDCIGTHGLDPATYPFTDTERYSELNYAVTALESRPNTSVYLDATHSAWMNVGDIATRLIQAGVNRAQGFFLNVSNYQYTANSTQYGTWISQCIALLGADPSASCPNQYWNGGPDGTKIASLLGAWTGVALDNYGQWSDTSDDPALNTSGINAQYASAISGSGVQATAHFVIDTSRNGTGANSMTAYTAAPYNQPPSDLSALQSGNWCNPPGAGLGLKPTTTTGVALLDAYLWVKTPGESDGQCNAAGAGRGWDYSAYTQPGWPTDPAGQASFDPLWGQVDPAAGDWFPAQMLDLIHHANPAVK